MNDAKCRLLKLQHGMSPTVFRPLRMTPTLVSHTPHATSVRVLQLSEDWKLKKAGNKKSAISSSGNPDLLEVTELIMVRVSPRNQPHTLS